MSLTSSSAPAAGGTEPQSASVVVGAASYGQILRSSALIGGSSVINIVIGMVRTKAMAMLLGPAGFGLMGLYSSIFDLARSLAGMGVNSSGVRQIAEAVGSGDSVRAARMVVVLRRVSLVLGLLGALLLVATAWPLSLLTFGDAHHTGAIALLGLAVFFRLVSDGQGALLQGMRRIADLAALGVLGTLAATMLAIPLIYFFREDGVVPVLVGGAAVMLLISWSFSRRVRINHPAMSFGEVRSEVFALLKLGMAFMLSGVLMMGVAYVVRLIVLRKTGLEAAGHYQSAWTLGGLYVSVVLQAMGADFFPRLTAVARNNAECNRLVNEQALVSLLLAGPGVLATLTLAPLVLVVFYSPEFKDAVSVLRWVCLGMTLRVVAWPMGFVILAKAEQMVFFWTELIAAVVHVSLAWLFVAWFGLNGAGIAFFGLYLWHGFLVYFVVRRMSGFRWSAANRHTGGLFGVLIAGVFCGFLWLPFAWATGLGLGAVLLSGIYSLRSLCRLVPLDRLPRPVRRLLISLRLAPTESATNHPHMD